MNKSIDYLKKRPWLIVSLVALFFLVALLFLVTRFGINTPYQDQFELILLFQKHQLGTLKLNDFFAPHNEHRLLFPTILMFYLGLLTHWNIKIEFLVSIFFAIITLIFALLLYKRSIPSKKYFVLASIATIIFLLSPVQTENWLWGWQMQWFMNIAGVIGSIYFVSLIKKDTSKEWLYLFIAFCLVFFAAFSLGSGLLLLPIIFIQLLLQKIEYKKIIAWVIASLGIVALYYYHYVSAAHESYFTILKKFGFYKYVLLYLGNPISVFGKLAWVIGIFILMLFIGLVVYLLIQFRSRLANYVGFISIGVYAILSAIITGFSRLALGTSQALSGRYITISQLLVLATIGLLAYLLSTNKNRSIMVSFNIIGLVIFGLISLGYIRGINMMRSDYNFKKVLQQCAVTQSNNEVCLLQMYPSSTQASERLIYLKSIDYGPYRNENK